MATQVQPRTQPVTTRPTDGVRAKREARDGLTLVSPTVIVVIVMVVLPVLWALVLSFQRVRLIDLQSFDLLGGEYTLANYERHNN